MTLASAVLVVSVAAAAHAQTAPRRLRLDDYPRVLDVKGGLSVIQWAPDSARLAFVMSDVNPADEPEKMEGWKRKTTPPIVLDRYHFKADREGYLSRRDRHIAVVDLATKSATALTSGQVDDQSPAWSPDGTRLAFLSKRAHADLDRTSNSDVWVVEAKAGSPPRQMTNTPEIEDGRSAWSPDGSRIAVLVGDTDTSYAYDLNQLGVIAANAPGPSAVRLLSPTLGPAVFAPSWSKDGQHISFLLEDDRSQQAASVPAEGGAGSSLQLTMYVMDRYIVQYEQELGPARAKGAFVDELTYVCLVATLVACGPRCGSMTDS